MSDTISFDTTENKALYGSIFGGAGLTLLSVVCLGIRFCRLRKKKALLKKKSDGSQDTKEPVLCLNIDSEVRRDPELPPVYNQAVSLEQHHERL